MHFTRQNRASPSQGPRSRANFTACSCAPNPKSCIVWCAEALPQREPSLRSNSLAANLLVALLHVHEIRVLVDLLLRVPELLLELELVLFDVVLELGDLLVVALLPPGLLLEVLLREVA